MQSNSFTEKSGIKRHYDFSMAAEPWSDPRLLRISDHLPEEDHCEDQEGLHGKIIKDILQKIELMNQKVEEVSARVGMVHGHHSLVQGKLREKLDDLETDMRQLIKDHAKRTMHDLSDQLTASDHEQPQEGQKQLTGDLEHEEIMIPRCLVSRVIGRLGSTITSIKRSSGVRRMTVKDDGKASRVQITGSTPAIKKAIGQLQNVLDGKTESVGLLCEKFKVTRKAGLNLIGPKGSRVKELQNFHLILNTVKFM